MAYVIGILLLASVGIWLVLSLSRDRREMRGDQARRDAKVAERRLILERMPDSVSAHEGLGDALREAGDLSGALTAYETALRLMATQPNSGAGQVAGSGLENKVRLTHFELTHDPAAQGLTLATRQQVCRRCGNLNGPQERACVTCGESLPVDSYFDAWKRDDHRTKILRETAESLAMLVVVVIALAIASGLSREVKGVLLLSTVIVLTWKGLRRVGGD